MPKLVPLRQWICDSCGKLIEQPEHGYVEWQLDEKTDAKQKFRIVHNGGYSPRKPDNDCFYSHQERGGDTALDRLLGDEGRVILTSWLDPGVEFTDDIRTRVASLREWVVLFRRLQVPYFEEARLYFDEAVRNGSLGGANEIYFYLPDMGLKDILEQYGEE